MLVHTRESLERSNYKASIPGWAPSEEGLNCCTHDRPRGTISLNLGKSCLHVAEVIQLDRLRGNLRITGVKLRTHILMPCFALEPKCIPACAFNASIRTITHGFVGFSGLSSNMREYMYRHLKCHNQLLLRCSSSPGSYARPHQKDANNAAMRRARECRRDSHPRCLFGAPTWASWVLPSPDMPGQHKRAA